MKSILITGCSSGYGLATARHFHAQGWNVIATMRTPRADVLPASDRVRVLPLDVTAPNSIAQALQAAGPIDVLVNNAGLGLFGAFEATPMTTVRDIFDTNTFGTMAMTQAVLPQMRERGAGLVVNVTSSATLAPMPLVAAYTASKTAIEGFTASLAFELAAFGVRVKLVEPGYALDRDGLMKAQARALLEASAGKVLNIMFPMVSEPWEFEAARTLVEHIGRLDPTHGLGGEVIASLLDGSTGAR